MSKQYDAPVSRPKTMTEGETVEVLNLSFKILINYMYIYMLILIVNAHSISYCYT